MIDALTVAVGGIIMTRNEHYNQNLWLYSVNGLNLKQMNNATMPFKKLNFDHDEITIVTEGLLNHLTMDEKKVVSQNIHSLLETFGGRWICSDLIPKDKIKASSSENTLIKNDLLRISQITGRNMNDNAFETYKETHKFFNDLGFRTETHDMFQNPKEISTLKHLTDMSQTEALKAVRRNSSWQNTWIMRN